jgi:hypothetical protein
MHILDEVSPNTGKYANHKVGTDLDDISISSVLTSNKCILCRKETTGIDGRRSGLGSVHRDRDLVGNASSYR